MVLPIAVGVAQLLFGMISVDTNLPKKRKANALAAAAVEEEEENINVLNPAKNKVTVSSQTYQNYKSALRWFHEYTCPAMGKVGMPWPTEVDLVLRGAISSYKRDVGDKKRRGVMKQKEGKTPYNLQGYITICKSLMGLSPQGNATTWNEGLFGSLFTKLSVNTIGRSDNIDDLLLKNIDWENDALTLLFSTTKADQAGETTSEKKRLYANPFTPCVCVVLDLAVYTWTKHRGSVASTLHLFDGDMQNKRYYHILVDTISKMPESLDLGCDRKDIGTHSNRKFAESTAVSKIDGPSRTQVCLRAGQGVGRTQDCYMFSEEDGDALVGRTVAQLKLDADEFDVLAPHFGTVTLEYLYAYGWSNILSGYDYYPSSFQRVVPYLLANLVYHWFKGNLSTLYASNHPLFAQPLFTEPTLLNSLRDKVIFVHSYCADTRMNAQGVPGIILISREVRQFRQLYDKTCSAYNTRIDGLSAQLNDAFTQLPQTIIEQLLERFQVNGVVPVTLNEIRSIIREMLSTNNQALSQSLITITEQQAAIMNTLNNNGNTSNGGGIHASGTTTTAPTGMLYHWRGIDDKMHTVPHGFVFPSYTCKTMWSLWFFGSPRDGICPYKNISSAYDLTTRKCKTNFCRAKQIMDKLIYIAINGTDGIEGGGIIACRGDLTTVNSAGVYDYAYPKLIMRLYRSPPPRPEDININTLANRGQRVEQE
jgi:hypothetical protein